jgi:hypothetical protein
MSLPPFNSKPVIPDMFIMYDIPTECKVSVIDCVIHAIHTPQKRRRSNDADALRALRQSGVFPKMKTRRLDENNRLYA